MVRSENFNNLSVQVILLCDVLVSKNHIKKYSVLILPVAQASKLNCNNFFSSKERKMHFRIVKSRINVVLLPSFLQIF